MFHPQCFISTALHENVLSICRWCICLRDWMNTGSLCKAAISPQRLVRRLIQLLRLESKSVCLAGFRRRACAIFSLVLCLCPSRMDRLEGPTERTGLLPSTLFCVVVSSLLRTAAEQQSALAGEGKLWLFLCSCSKISALSFNEVQWPHWMCCCFKLKMDYKRQKINKLKCLEHIGLRLFIVSATHFAFGYFRDMDAFSVFFMVKLVD